MICIISQKNKGWRFESHRHALASKGIKTAQKLPKTVKVDLNKYAGKWYQISAFPSWFQEGCKNAIAEYEKKNGVLNVKNSCVRDGKLNVAYAKAYPEGTGKLKVDFVGGRLFEGDYWVLKTDYETAIVGTPDRKYLWILARNKNISNKKIKQLEKFAESQGFDISRLRR